MPSLTSDAVRPSIRMWFAPLPPVSLGLPEFASQLAAWRLMAVMSTTKNVAFCFGASGVLGIREWKHLIWTAKLELHRFQIATRVCKPLPLLDDQREEVIALPDIDDHRDDDFGQRFSEVVREGDAALLATLRGDHLAWLRPGWSSGNSSSDAGSG